MEISENKEWRVKDGFNRYKISNDGRVYSSYMGGRLLKMNPNKDGYPQVKLYNELGHFTFRVHRLVAELFIQNPETKPEVNHKNGIKSDNRVENLEWVTDKENVCHGIETGLIKRLNGVSHYKAILNDELVGKIREMARTGLSFCLIGRMTNLHHSTIGLAATGKNWAHLNDKYPPVPSRGKIR